MKMLKATCKIHFIKFKRRTKILLYNASKLPVSTVDTPPDICILFNIIEIHITMQNIQYQPESKDQV